MRQYLDLLNHILRNGVDKGDRTGTGTVSVFGYQMRFDLSKGFPLLTTKRLPFKAIAHELLWFLRGDTNVAYLQEHGVTIWDEWADPVTGELGPIYGKQWRSWSAYEPVESGESGVLSMLAGHGAPVCTNNSIDQIADVIERIKRDPNSRRLLVTAWNPAELNDARLPPCHVMFQFYVHDGKLSCQLYQRSADVFLGVPFNIASYALLTKMIAHVTGLAPGEFIWTGGDCHLYVNHLQQVHDQLARELRPLPILHFDRIVEDIDDFRFEDFRLTSYDPHPAIKAPVAV